MHDLRGEGAPLAQTSGSAKWRRTLWAIWIALSVAWGAVVVPRLFSIERENAHARELAQQGVDCAAKHHDPTGCILVLDPPDPTPIDVQLARVFGPPLIVLAAGAMLYRVGVMLRR